MYDLSSDTNNQIAWCNYEDRAAMALIEGSDQVDLVKTSTGSHLQIAVNTHGLTYRTVALVITAAVKLA